MVGREREMAFLYDSWQRATLGDGHIVLLGGEAGMDDTQRIKGMYDRGDDATSAGRKAVMGALSLYLNFINLFMMPLRLMGGDARMAISEVRIQ
jgi:Inhibitor of apoptosis-promoting Bax1